MEKEVFQPRVFQTGISLGAELIALSADDCMKVVTVM